LLPQRLGGTLVRVDGSGVQTTAFDNMQDRRASRDQRSSHTQLRRAPERSRAESGSKASRSTSYRRSPRGSMGGAAWTLMGTNPAAYEIGEVTEYGLPSSRYPRSRAPETGSRTGSSPAKD
jgi:hypothetical protein